MADGGVKNRAKLFEQTSNDCTGAPPLRKPPVATKPKPFAKPEAASTGKESEETNPFKKFGAKTSTQDDATPAPGFKVRGGLNNSFSGKGLGNDNSSDSNNNKNAVSKEKDSKDLVPPKKALLPPKSPNNTQNAEGGEKPALKPKIPTPGSKPIVTDKPKLPTITKVPLLPKPELAKSDVNKSDSVCSTSSNSSNSSISSPSPSANNVAKDKGQFNFSKNLRPVVLNGLPPKRTINSFGSENTPDSPKSESDPSSPSPPPLPKTAPPLPASLSKSKSQHEDEQVFITDTKPNINLIEKRSKLKSRGKSIEKEEGEEASVVLRQSDGKKFRKITLEKSTHSATAPEKPTLPTDIDLSTIRKEYEKAKGQPEETCSVTTSIKQEEKEPEVIQDIEEEEDDEMIYDPVVSMPCVPEMRPKKEESEASRISDRISVIPDLTAEEEAEGFCDNADEMYTGAESVISTIKEEPGETEQERKRRKKEEEKERKEREKQEREQEKQRKRKEEEKEKQRKKQEEEEAKRRKTFKITGKEQFVEGEITEDAKGGNLNLKVRKGQKVTIVLTDNKPANKWLVKTDTQMGYVDVANICVDPDIIRQAMTRDRKESAVEEEDDQPTYDDVPGDTSGGGSTPAVEEMEYEDVYEEL